MRILQHLKGLDETLAEPSFSATGLDNSAVFETVVESRSFLHKSSDSDSDVVVARTVELNSDHQIITATAWDVTNAPEITSVATDQDNDQHISLAGTTQITISGSNFGANDEDLAVIVSARQSPSLLYYYPSRALYKATITSVSGGDDEIVATITLDKVLGQKAPTTGPCDIYVVNTRRHLASDMVALTVS